MIMASLEGNKDWMRARVVVMMGVKMMSLMSVMMMMISYNGVDGDNKRTKVLMIKRSFV